MSLVTHNIMNNSICTLFDNILIDIHKFKSLLYLKRYNERKTHYIYTPKGIIMEPTTLSKYVKDMRKQYNLTQVELSEKSGVGLRFVRELEQGKQTLRLDKVNQILNLFGNEVGAVPISKEDEP